MSLVVMHEHIVNKRDFLQEYILPPRGRKAVIWEKLYDNMNKDYTRGKVGRNREGESVDYWSLF